MNENNSINLAKTTEVSDTHYDQYQLKREEILLSQLKHLLEVSTDTDEAEELATLTKTMLSICCYFADKKRKSL